MPLVSIVTPFHRVLPYLRETVESVRRQTLRDWELLLVDNGTGAGLAPLGEAAADARIRLLALDRNLGTAHGRNHGVAHARGEFVALLDYDDIARPDRLEKQVTRLRASPRLGLVAGGAELLDEQGAVRGRGFALGREQDQLVFSAYTVPALTSSYTGRREVFHRFPFRTEFRAAEDYDFISRAVEHTAIESLPDTVVGYRVYGRQTSRTHEAAQVLEANLVRLMTARRRAGRVEDLVALAAEFAAWRAAPPPPAESCLHFSDRALRESLPLLGVYLARRHVGYARTARALGRATRRLARAVRLEPRLAPLLTGMFLGGPLRAHRLRPV